MNRFRKSVGAFLLIGAGAGAWFGGSALVDNVKFARAEEQVKATREQIEKIEDLATVFRQVGKVVEPSVVNIQVKKTVKGAASTRMPFDDDMLRRFFPDQDGDGEPDVPRGFGGPGGGEEGNEQIGTGSGVIMEVADGAAYIMTNNHVAGGATELTVTLSDGREITNGKVLGTDSKSDLAVVKITADRLIPAKWGNSEELQKGDWILAFGSPFGYVGSMTHGIVSALNRRAGILGSQGYESFIQVDAPINPGNSGGPLVNIHGEVVGINTAIASRTGGFQGIGFAIPSNQAQYVYSQLKDRGKVVRGWLGVGIDDVSRNLQLAKSFGYEGSDGVLVQQTFPNTPATGKLKEGDIITALNGKPVKNVQELRNAVAATAPNTELTLAVFRDGKSEDVKIKLGEQPEDLASVAGRRGESGGGSGPTSTGAADALGMKLNNVSEDLAKRFGLDDVKGGALVTEVDRNSAAAKAGLRPGDVITRVGNQTVNSADEALSAIGKNDVSKGIRLYVTSRDGSRFVFVKGNDKAQ